MLCQAKEATESNALKTVFPLETVGSFLVMVQIGCDQLMDTLLIGWWEVSGSQHHQPSGSSGSGAYVLVGTIWFTSPTCWGFQDLHNSSKILCVFLEEKPGSRPKAALLLLLIVHPSLSVSSPVPN